MFTLTVLLPSLQAHIAIGDERLARVQIEGWASHACLPHRTEVSRGRPRGQARDLVQATREIRAKRGESPQSICSRDRGPAPVT